MKRNLIIFFVSFSFSLLWISFISYAGQTNLPTYYPSPSNTYTTIKLINKNGGPNENATGKNRCFCAQNSLYPTGVNTTTLSCDTGDSGATYTNPGIIFADPSTGFLEICKGDGSVSSYPGSCFNRFGQGGSGPSCPNNYQVVNPGLIVKPGQTFSMTGSNSIISWICCFTGQGNKTLAQGVPFTKSGCFSIYSTLVNPIPDSCNSLQSGDPNAYDIGCEAISSSDMPAGKPVLKRNCCFNYSAGSYTLGQSSPCCPSPCPAGQTCQFSGTTPTCM